MFGKYRKPFYVADGVPGGQPPANPQPPAGDTPPANPSGTGEPELTPEQAKKIIADLRRENASHRTKLTAFEKAQQEAEAAKLSELEKAQRKAADAEAKAAQQDKALQEMRVTLAIERNAAKLNIVDPEAAVKLIDLSAIEYDDNGNPKNIEALLDALVKNKPYLVAQQGQPPRSQAQGGATNPPRSQSGSGGLTREIIERMKPEEHRARQKEIHEWLRQQK